jgi:hypothetical protein
LGNPLADGDAATRQPGEPRQRPVVIPRPRIGRRGVGFPARIPRARGKGPVKRGRNDQTGHGTRARLLRACDPPLVSGGVTVGNQLRQLIQASRRRQACGRRQACQVRQGRLPQQAARPARLAPRRPSPRREHAHESRLGQPQLADRFFAGPGGYLSGRGLSVSVGTTRGRHVQQLACFPSVMQPLVCRPEFCRAKEPLARSRARLRSQRASAELPLNWRRSLGNRRKGIRGWEQPQQDHTQHQTGHCEARGIHAMSPLNEHLPPGRTPDGCSSRGRWASFEGARSPAYSSARSDSRSPVSVRMVAEMQLR